jgi:[ribosomal protein S5]-alanine N-acetyltransferase
METIKTSFGLIRPWRAEDATAVVKYGNNRKIWSNLRDGFPYPYTLEAAQSFIKNAIQQSPVTYFAIATPEETIGGIGVTPNADVHRLTAEMGYWLGEPFWGRGIMSETVRVFSDWVFERLGLVRIYAEPYARNQASARVLEKAGFELEGRLRASVIKDGQIGDQLMYAKIRLP